MEPAFALERAAALRPTRLRELRLGGRLQALKEPGTRRPALDFQEALLKWARTARIDEGTERTGRFERPELLGAPFEAYDEIVGTLEAWCRELPEAVHPDDVEGLSRCLLRVVYVLRRSWLLHGAVDFMEAVFYLQERLGRDGMAAFCYRTAAYLAMDLGDLKRGRSLIQRAKLHDFRERNRQGLLLSIEADGFMAYAAGSEMAVHCWSKILQALPEDEIPSSHLPLNLARAYLSIGQVEKAWSTVTMTRLERLRPEIDRSAYLGVLGECFSLMGNEDKAREFLDQALPFLQDHPRDLALLRLGRCLHFLRYENTEEARSEAIELLRLSRLLPRNMAAALEKLAVVILQGGDRATASAAAERASHQVTTPNLCKHRQDP